jgi:hypothetical protein
MDKMNYVEGRQSDTEIASDAAVIRTRISSTTQIENLDNFAGLSDNSCKQSGMYMSCYLAPPPFPDYTSLPHSRVFSAQFDTVCSPAEYLFTAGDLHLKVSCTES